MAEKPLVTIHAYIRCRVDAATVEEAKALVQKLEGLAVDDQVLIELVEDVALGLTEQT